MNEKQHQEWKKDLEELHEVKAENKELRDDFETIEIMYNALKPVNEHLEAENERLKEVIETAISQHHRVRPNTVVDILIRKYEALKGKK